MLRPAIVTLAAAALWLAASCGGESTTPATTDAGPSCPSGTEGCACYGNQTCSGALECVDGLCAPSSCATGAEGCPCFGNGTCLNGELECVEGACQPISCELGSEGCACFGNGTCHEGLACESNTCVVPPCDGALYCACLPGNRCDDDLVCENNWCVEPAPCPEGTLGCACTAEDACDGELVCDAGLCIEDPCVDGTIECPCITPGDLCGDLNGVELECVDGLCAVLACPSGSEGCPCRAGGVCDFGLECRGDVSTSTCEQCTAGTLGCPCDTGDTCESGLWCVDGACAELTCDIGDVGCFCAPDLSCAGNGTYCDDAGICQQAPCPTGAEGCPCGGDDACGVNSRGESMVCVSGLCQAPSCAVAATGCACAWATDCDDAGDVCVDGFCMPADCAAGTESCGCAGGDCVGELSCRDDVICVDQTGYLGGLCYADGSCAPGLACADYYCELCDLGTLGCACKADGSCAAGLVCYQDACVDPTVTVLPPDTPVCYTHCERNLVLDDGSFVDCPADGLMVGCYDGLECNQGTCVVPGEDPPGCTTELECPDWQTCIDGGCYSNCSLDSHCADGESCVRKVCRQLCEVDQDECPAGTTCISDDGQLGACYQLDEPGETSQTEVHAAFEFEDQGLDLTNVKTSTSIKIINNSEGYEFFTVRKRSHRTYSDSGEAIEYDDPLDDTACDPLIDCPLTWLAIGPDENTALVQEFEVGIDGEGGSFVVDIEGAGNVDAPRWDGRLEIVHATLGTRVVQLNYNESPEGRWTGKMYYFATFDDTNLAEWRDSADKSDPGAVKNALVRKWAAFRLGDISWENFEAVLQATRNESWRWGTVAADCDAILGADACYLFDLYAHGLVTYATDLDANPIPTGVAELPVSMNLRIDDTSLGLMQGRIESELALHLPGNPAITLDFGSDPAGCDATDSAGNCKVFVESLDVQVLLGGRYESDSADSNCAERDDSDYLHHQVPWLVPGFTRGTEYDASSGLRYRYECRDSYLPFNSGAELTTEQITANVSLSLANPIPDGRTRRRSLTLLDGALINQSTLFLLFEEKYEAFIPTDDDPTTPEDESSFSAYGYLLLQREAVELDTDTDVDGNDIPDAYEGSEITDARPDPQAELLGVECSESLLEELAQASDEIDGSVTSANAATVAQLLITGKALVGQCGAGKLCRDGFCETQTCDSLGCSYSADQIDACVDPHIDAASDEEVHYLCHDTGYFDGGPGATTDFWATVVNDDTCGFASPVDNHFDGNGICEDGGPDSESSICDLGTDLMDCGVRTAKDEDQRVPCPYGSEVSFFTIDKNTWNEGAIADQACQLDDPPSCFDTLIAWRDAGKLKQLDPVWHCEDRSQAFCESDRHDLRSDKLFYAWTESTVALPSLHGEIDHAFRYKTKFQSRDGSTPGFAPDECVTDSNLVPYCYDPPKIEALRERIDCLLYVWRHHSDDVSGVTGDDGEDLGDTLDDVLCTTFAYAEACLPGQSSGGVHDGFERLYAELLVMMGDESYTQAFSSRFDLAGESPKSFEGELFEEGGINLSGSAGYEMYSLYQAAQYYQEVLDRFYSLTPVIWESLDALLDVTDSRANFVTQETVTRYLERVTRASTQKSRAWSAIAERYQDFNRAELAARVIERAYTATYVESIVTAQLLHKIYKVLSLADREQVMVVLEDSQRRYRMALLDMQNIYSAIGGEITYFGMAPEYIPFPTLNYNADNAFEALLMRAKSKLDVALAREDKAIERSKAFDVDAAEFQSELVRLRNNYEAQLGDLCGTFESGGKIYPAITRYAELHEHLKKYGDPCGLAENGSLYEARIAIDEQKLDLLRIRAQYDNILAEASIEKSRVEAQCDLTFQLADFKYQQAGEIADLQGDIHTLQTVISGIDRSLSTLANVSHIANCSALNGQCAVSLGLAATLTYASAAGNTFAIASEMSIHDKEAEIAAVEAKTAKWETEQQCTAALIDANARMATVLLRVKEVELEALRAQHTLQRALSEVAEQRNRAKRIENELAESEQMAVNVFAARSDPNVRIYRDDAVVNAEIAFEDAIREVYRTTRVFEYYSSQSYAPMEQLFLIRMVQFGDYNLQNYLTELENDFYAFEEIYGLPDTRVALLSLRDDILAVPYSKDDGTAYSQTERIEMMRAELANTSRLDSRGYLTISFPTQLDALSPLTRVHKVYYIESEIVGADVGDSIGRLYLRQYGTGVIRSLEDEKLYFRFPERTAVLNPFFNGNRYFDAEVYKNQKLRDRPYINTAWDLVINQRDEEANQDIDLQSLTDIRLFVYYRDFTAL